MVSKSQKTFDTLLNAVTKGGRQYYNDYPLFDEWTDWPLPKFAHAKAKPGVIEPMLQLCTRDGQRTGNATVAFITVNTRVPDPVLQTFFHVYTDADNVMILNIEELNELFTFGPYVLKDFPNPLSRER